MKKKNEITDRDPHASTPAAPPDDRGGQRVASARPAPPPAAPGSPRAIAVALNTPPAGLVPVAPARATTLGAAASGSTRRTVAPRPDEHADAAEYAEALIRFLTEGRVDEHADDRPEPVLSFRQCVQQNGGHAESLIVVLGGERFALSLALVDEAVEEPDVHTLPESSATMLGVFDLRGKLVPIYSPAQALGVSLGRIGAALVMRAGDRRVALAVDDVDDVLTLDFADVRDAPGGGDADGVLLGVTHRDADLVAVVDVEALLAACLSSVPSHTREKP